MHLTHGPEELLVQFKGHERVGKITEPLFEHAGDDVNIVVVQTNAIHIWKKERGVTLSSHLETEEFTPDTMFFHSTLSVTERIMCLLYYYKYTI